MCTQIYDTLEHKEFLWTENTMLVHSPRSLLIQSFKELLSMESKDFLRWFLLFFDFDWFLLNNFFFLFLFFFDIIVLFLHSFIDFLRDSINYLNLLRISCSDQVNGKDYEHRSNHQDNDTLDNRCLILTFSSLCHSIDKKNYKSILLLFIKSVVSYHN